MFNYPIGSSGSPKTKKVSGGKADGAEASGHGPAREVHVEHEHEMGSHHVHSVHDDGHEHHSDHATAEEAHEMARKLGTEGAPDDNDGDVDEMPVGAEAE